MESVPLVKELGCMDMKITKGRHYKASSADIYGWDRWTLEETKWFLAISVIKMSDDTSMVVDGFFSCQDKMGYVVKWNTDPEDNPLEFPSPRAGVSVRKLPLWAFRGYSSVTVTVFRRRDRVLIVLRLSIWLRDAWSSCQTFMSSYTLSEKAYFKVFFHASKRPHRQVNGVLLGKKEGAAILIEDAVPLLHHWTSLSPMMEIGYHATLIICFQPYISSTSSSWRPYAGETISFNV